MPREGGPRRTNGKRSHSDAESKGENQLISTGGGGRRGVPRGRGWGRAPRGEGADSGCKTTIPWVRNTVSHVAKSLGVASHI